MVEWEQAALFLLLSFQAPQHHTIVSLIVWHAAKVSTEWLMRRNASEDTSFERGTGTRANGENFMRLG